MIYRELIVHVYNLLTTPENLRLKAITSANDRTGDTTKSFRYAFKASLNSASDAVFPTQIEVQDNINVGYF